jgi:hypothetical protein
MNFIDKLIEGKLDEAKQSIFNRLNEIVYKRLKEEKKDLAEEIFEDVEQLDEAVPRRNPNIIRMGRVKRIRRRIRRDSKGKIVIQKNRRRSGIPGYRISGKGNVVKRIPTVERLRKSRLLKRAWKTTRRAKLRRTLLKRKISMRRRASLGLR